MVTSTGKTSQANLANTLIIGALPFKHAKPNKAMLKIKQARSKEDGSWRTKKKNISLWKRPNSSPKPTKPQAYENETQQLNNRRCDTTKQIKWKNINRPKPMWNAQWASTRLQNYYENAICFCAKANLTEQNEMETEIYWRRKNYLMQNECVCINKLFDDMRSFYSCRYGSLLCGRHSNLQSGEMRRK